MSDVRDVGDFRIPTLPVVAFDGTPGDATTGTTLSVLKPDGTTSTLTTSTPDAGASWVGQTYQLATAGLYVERWTVTGKGAGSARESFWVLPDPATSPSGERQYATTTDYINYAHEAPDDDVNPRRMLAAATRVVEGMLTTAIYDIDSVTLLPTDPAALSIIRDAVCEQARWQLENGDPYAIGSNTFSLVQAGGITVSQLSPQNSGDAPGRRSPEALAILQRGGLTNQEPLTEVAWWRF